MYKAVAINEHLESLLNGELCFSHLSLFSDEYEYINNDIKSIEIIKKTLEENSKENFRINDKKFVENAQENRLIMDKIRVCCFFAVPPKTKVEDVYSKFSKNFHIKNEGMSKKEIILEYGLDEINPYLLKSEEDKKKYEKMMKESTIKLEEILTKYDTLPVAYCGFIPDKKIYSEFEKRIKEDLEVKKWAKDIFEKNDIYLFV